MSLASGRPTAARIADGFTGCAAATHLDMTRGLAAVAVLVFHLRYRFFLDYADVESPGGLATAWYFVSAFGHDAVMVFFVLSGFLIGSSVRRSHLAGRWNSVEYATSRGVRLLVVLVPGLLLTTFWDQLGLRWFPDAAIYAGSPQPYVNDYFNVASRSGLVTGVGNLMFLQTILVSPFGSNDALWSLAYEGWYYVLFPPLVALVARRQPMWFRGAAMVAALGIAAFVGPTIRAYFLFWLTGAAVSLLPVTPLLLRQPRAFLLTAVGLCGVLVTLTHVGVVRAQLGSLYAADAVTAGSFALCLYVMLHDRRPEAPGPYMRTATVLAGCSFTLYVVHLPLLVFLRAAVNPGRPWEPTPATLGLTFALGVVTVLYAYGVARVTEAHTASVRHAVSRWFASRPLGRRFRLHGSPTPTGRVR